jgi:Fe-S oxidoreductase
LKQAPVMCPTFIATGREIMSTRGRANTIRAALEGRLGGEPCPLELPELEEALSNCLSCKACTVECPSNVNLPLLKAELVHARQQQQGLPLRVRAISAADLLGRVGCTFPRLANALLKSGLSRSLMRRALGFAPERPLPAYASERFDRWFARRPAPNRPVTRGKVILWDDTFVRYHEPPVGRAAVRVLEAAGFEVTLLTGRACCGRPAFSQGNLSEAARLGRHNLDLLASQNEVLPVIFLEPSCWAMFADDYRELKLPGAEAIAQRCFLFEQFVEELLAREPGALSFSETGKVVAIHGHCHAKALASMKIMPALAARVPGTKARLLDTGCCGMAGAFGYLEEKQELSRAVAQPLVDQIAALPPGSVVIASGTSCRQQIEHLCRIHPRHMAEWLAGALDEPR